MSTELLTIDSNADHSVPGPVAGGRKRFHCGTLTYTTAGLTALFAWLLWGDFCFTLMETVGGIIPLTLKSLGASNLVMQVILTTLPSVLNATVCPWVSFKSDRHRGPWGRRIPFILSTMPFLAISLALVGWSQDISPWAQRVIVPLHHVAPATVTVGLIAIFMVAFSFFNTFVNSVFWYLFNDVVPPQFLGRFTGLFRLVGTGAGSLYSFYIFPLAETHLRAILTGAALLYFIGFGLMCLRVKEGEYPPVPIETSTHRKSVADILAFFRQSFSARIYWYFYLSGAIGNMGGAMGLYVIFFNKQMGMTLEQMGSLGGIGAIAALAATYSTAVYVDRWHPLRITTYLAIFGAVGGFGAWIWLPVTLPGTVYYWLALGGTLINTFGTVLGAACFLPLCMRVLPKSLYGQFCSANAMVRSLTAVVSSLLAGVVMDGIVHLCHGSDFAYRWIFVWGWLFGCVSAVFFYLLYREWRRLGGDDDYRPPAPWLPGGFEEVTDKVKSVLARPRAVMISMWLGLIASLVNLAMVLIFMAFMRERGMLWSLTWYATVFVPVKLILTVASYVQLVHVRRDIAAAAEGRSIRFGIPHHGVLLVNAIQSLLYFPIYWLQTIWMIHLKMERELILFGLASLLLMAAGIIGVQIVRWMERPVGRSMNQ